MDDETGCGRREADGCAHVPCRDNKLGAEGGKAVADALTGLTSLEKLILRYVQ